MSIVFLLKCRIVQLWNAGQKRLHPVREQVVEAGAGAVFSVPQILRAGKKKKPLLVLGSGTERLRLGLLQALEENDIEYSVWECADASEAEKIRDFHRQEACDCYVVLGDAPVMDAVKLAARRGAAIVAVPTVAGTAAEALSSVRVKTENDLYTTLEDGSLVPAFLVQDPELLDRTSRQTVAEAGMDGLCRAVEAYLAPVYGTEKTRADAAASVKGFLDFLEPCWNNGGSVEQRAGLLEASRLAGAAASVTGYGYIRALSDAVSDFTKCSFGEACGAILPAVLEKYGISAQERLAKLAVFCGILTTGTVNQKASALIERIRTLVFRIGLPEHLKPLTEEQTEVLAKQAAEETNPKCACPAVWDAEQCVHALMAACREA